MIPVPLFLLPLSIFQGCFQLSPFFASLALRPKDVATKKYFNIINAFTQMSNTCFLPYGLVNIGPQARNCQNSSSQLLMILALTAFQNLAPQALQLGLEKKKGSSLKSQSVQVCVFHEN